MDEDTQTRLSVIASAERFEKYLEENDDDIMRLIHLPVEQWTANDVLAATAGLATQRAVLLTEKMKRSARQRAER